MTQKTATQEEATVKVRVAVGRESGRMRAGRNWPQGVTEATVTTAQLAMMKGDPYLSVTELEDGQGTYEGLTLPELEDRAEKAAEALDAALKAEYPDTDAGAELAIRVPSPADQKASKDAEKARKGTPAKASAQKASETPKAQEGQPQGQAGPYADVMAKTVPDSMPYAELFKSAGKTLGDVLLMRDASTLVSVPDIGAARAGEVAIWLEDPANADALKG